MGINDLQAQINRLNSMVTRFRAQIGSLTAQVQLAEQNAATTNAWFPNEFVGAGGSGGTTYGSGNGINITSGQDPELISVELASSDSGLHFPSAKLAVEVESGGGIDINGGVGLRIDFDGQPNINGELDETSGGTGQSSYFTGDILYGKAVDTLDTLSGGSAKQILCMDQNALYPVWVSPWKVAGDTGIEAVSMDATLTVKGGTGIETEASELIGGDKQVEVTLKDIGGVSGSYTNSNITVDGQGRITTASDGSGGGSGTVTEVDAGPGLYTEPEAGITTTGTIHINPGTAISLSDPPDSTVDVDIYGAPAFVDDTLDREDAILAADDDDPYQVSKKVKFKEMDMTFFTGTTSRLYGTDTSGDVSEIAFGNFDQVLTSNGTTVLPSFKDAAGGSGSTIYAAVLDNNLEFTERTNAGAIQTTTATIQQTNTSTGTLENGTTVNVFSYGGYNGYSTGGQRVQIVKDPPMTSYKGSDWYRVLSDMTQDILVRVCGYDSSGGSQGVGNGIPYVGTTPNGLGVNGTVRVYRPIGNYPGQSTNASAMILYADFTEDYLRNTEGTKTQAVDIRFRMGMVPNQKDMYKAKFWPGGAGQPDFFVVEELYGIMALVVPSTTAGYPPNNYVGVTRWYDITPGVGGDFAEWPEGAAMGWFYWMGQRRNIIGQFKSDCDSGDSQQFMLARTKLTGGTTNPCTPTGGSYNGTMEFANEIQHGNAVTNQSGPTVSSGQNWNVTFARGQVYNVAAFKLSGDATLNDGDICAAQYDEESGTYLAAPLRCS